MKLAHILLVVWQNGYSELLTDNYEHCWDMDGLIRQEIEYHTPEGAGNLLMTRCEPTQIVTAAPVPQLRPEAQNNDRRT